MTSLHMGTAHRAKMLSILPQLTFQLLKSNELGSILTIRVPETLGNRAWTQMQIPQAEQVKFSVYSIINPKSEKQRKWPENS